MIKVVFFQELEKRENLLDAILFSKDYFSIQHFFDLKSEGNVAVYFTLHRLTSPLPYRPLKKFF